MSWFPFTREGRQTLVYCALAGCGPALTAIVVWALVIIRNWSEVPAIIRLDKFAELAMLVAVGLLIIVIALACFVSIRAIKIGKDGIEASGDGDGG